MFPKVEICFQGFGKYICCCIKDDESDSDSTRSSERPLLDRSPPFSPVGSLPSSPTMPPKKIRTYGSKRSAVSSGSAVIFGGRSVVASSGGSTVVASSDGNSVVASSGGSSVVANPASTVDSVADLLSQSHLDETRSQRSDLSDHHLPFAFSDPAITESHPNPGFTLPKSKRRATVVTSNPALAGLEPLVAAHKIDTGSSINVLDWTTVLPHGSNISKIAEASYAEVYRVTTSAGSSIVKIMQLKVPSDASSYDIETANAVENVVSEIRIMNALTEVPGYVTFKGTYIVKGPPPKDIVAAYEAHLENRGDEEGSYFPHPGTAFNVNSTFLVLELGDAGNVLEDVLIQHIDQVWDIFLGVVMALSRAEITNQFEHRDLHENNICVRVSNSPPPKHPSPSGQSSDLKFGFSGLQVTLIDYGLSRALLESGDVIYNNLESDLALFHSVSTGIAGIQFDSYRRMRTHHFTGTHSMYPPSWHDEKSLPSVISTPWKVFMPYTNVLWIRYILTYLLSSYKSTVCPTPSLARRDLDLGGFTAQTRELTKRLNVKTKVENGAFTSAEEILAFVVGQGWVSEDQLEKYGVDESTLVEVSELIESEDDSDSDSSDSTSSDEDE